MKLIKPSFEIIEQLPGEEGIYKQIELAGRVCYKSENHITEDSYKNFCEMIKSKQHLSVFEHGTVYLRMNLAVDNILTRGFYLSNPYSKAIYDPNNPKEFFITTNIRVLLENNRLEDFKYLCEPTKYHEKRYTIKFICDRGVSHEFVRHRAFSFSQESTRYCNYSKNKFNNEITFIIPCWTNLKEVDYSHYDGSQKDWFTLTEAEKVFVNALRESELKYLQLTTTGSWTPQQARAVLPNSLKTELVMTGFVSDWKHFFLLRSNRYGRGGAHPQSDELATPLYEKFISNGYINSLN